LQVCFILGWTDTREKGTKTSVYTRNTWWQ